MSTDSRPQNLAGAPITTSIDTIGRSWGHTMALTVANTRPGHGEHGRRAPAPNATPAPAAARAPRGHAGARHAHSDAEKDMDITHNECKDHSSGKRHAREEKDDEDDSQA